MRGVLASVLLLIVSLHLLLQLAKGSITLGCPDSSDLQVLHNNSFIFDNKFNTRLIDFQTSPSHDNNDIFVLFTSADSTAEIQHGNTTSNLVIFNGETKQLTVVESHVDTETNLLAISNSIKQNSITVAKRTKNQEDSTATLLFSHYRGQTEEYSFAHTDATAAQDPIYDKNGTVVGNEPDDSSISATHESPVQMALVDAETTRMYALISNQYARKLFFYPTGRSATSKFVVVPGVQEVTKTHLGKHVPFEVSKTKVYLVLRLFKDEQAAFEAHHNLEHNKVVFFSASATGESFAEVLMVISMTTDTPKLIKIVQIYPPVGIELSEDFYVQSIDVSPDGNDVAMAGFFMSHGFTHQLTAYAYYNMINSSQPVIKTHMVSEKSNRANTVLITASETGKLVAIIGGSQDFSLSTYGNSYLMVVELETGNELASQRFDYISKRGDGIIKLQDYGSILLTGVLYDMPLSTDEDKHVNFLLGKVTSSCVEKHKPPPPPQWLLPVILVAVVSIGLCFIGILLLMLGNLLFHKCREKQYERV